MNMGNQAGRKVRKMCMHTRENEDRARGRRQKREALRGEKDKLCVPSQGASLLDAILPGDLWLAEIQQRRREQI